MARVKMEGFESLEKMFSKLSDPKKMAITAIDEAAPVLKKHLQAEITSAAEHPTGDLASHIEVTKAKKNEYGVFSVVKPDSGKDKGGIPYADRLRFLDVGRHDVSGKWHSGKGVRQRAVNSARGECEDILKEHLERFLEDAGR